MHVLFMSCDRSHDLYYTGVQQKTTYKCAESDEEPDKTEIEKSYQLSCFISQSESVILQSTICT